MSGLVNLIFVGIKWLGSISFGAGQMMALFQTWSILRYAAGAAIMYMVLKFVAAGINECLVKIGLIGGVGSIGGVTDFSEKLSAANYILPIEEFFSYVIILVSLWATVAAYRFVKSWLPSLS